MDTSFASGSGASSTALAGPVQNASPIAEGGTVTVTSGQQNASLLLNPSGSRNLVNVILPNPPRDGQILTIGATQMILMVQFTPDVPSSPDTWDANDVFQIKWFSALSLWILLK